MATARAVLVFDYEITDDLEERFKDYGTRDLIEACIVDENQARGIETEFVDLVLGDGLSNSQVISFRITPLIELRPVHELWRREARTAGTAASS